MRRRIAKGLVLLTASLTVMAAWEAYCHFAAPYMTPLQIEDNAFLSTFPEIASFVLGVWGLCLLASSFRRRRKAGEGRE